jgi:hypothetical protein
VHLTGVHLMGVYLMGVRLTGVHLRKCGRDVVLVNLRVSLLKRPGLAGEFASQLVSTVNLHLGNRAERIKDSDV